jgi:hypothetical protein
MTGRVLSAILTLVMLGAPLSVDLCQMTCAAAESRTADSSATAAHTCHEHAMPAPATTTIAALPHGCGHDDELPTGGSSDILTFGSQPALAPLATLAGLDVPPLASNPVDSPSPTASPGTGGRALVPLRI